MNNRAQQIAAQILFRPSSDRVSSLFSSSSSNNDNKIVADYDDDDISQHEVMVPHDHGVGTNAMINNSTTTMTSSSSNTTTTTTATGYRRIEDWHNDNHDPQHVLKQLQQEQAKWKRKFEDLGGDGI